MKKHPVTFRGEIDFKSLGMPEEEIQEAAQVIRDDPSVDEIEVSNVRVEDGIIHFNCKTTTEADNPGQAIAAVRMLLSGGSEPNPGFSAHDFQAQEV